MKEGETRLDLRLPVTEPGRASDLLAAASGLARMRVKDAMAKGAVWLQPARGKGRRLRRATAEVREGDSLRLCYDEKLLASPVPAAVCLEDHHGYSLWFKPAGLLSQGTDFGDFCSLLRQAELYFVLKRQVFLVHRLDREACGLMLVAHARKAAARLSGYFAGRQVEKIYLAGIRGRLIEGEVLLLDSDLHGKEAVSLCLGLAYHPATNESLVLVRPETGRLHQIRRHLAGQGTPIIGDRRYGGAAHGDLRLCAVRLVLRAEGKAPGLDLRLPPNFLPGWAGGAASSIPAGFVRLSRESMSLPGNGLLSGHCFGR